jgi:hypothetical protein
MPLVTIDMHDHLASRRAEISDAIHGGLVEGWKFPADDLFQIFHLHKEGELIYSRTYPDADRTDIVFVHILVFNGYSPDVKQAGAALVVDRLAALGIKRDNVLISLTENGDGDWLAPRQEDCDGTR